MSEEVGEEVKIKGRGSGRRNVGVYVIECYVGIEYCLLCECCVSAAWCCVSDARHALHACSTAEYNILSVVSVVHMLCVFRSREEKQRGGVVWWHTQGDATQEHTQRCVTPMTPNGHTWPSSPLFSSSWWPWWLMVCLHTAPERYTIMGFVGDVSKQVRAIYLAKCKVFIYPSFQYLQTKYGVSHNNIIHTSYYCCRIWEYLQLNPERPRFLEIFHRNCSGMIYHINKTSYSVLV